MLGKPPLEVVYLPLHLPRCAICGLEIPPSRLGAAARLALGSLGDPKAVPQLLEHGGRVLRCLIGVGERALRIVADGGSIACLAAESFQILAKSIAPAGTAVQNTVIPVGCGCSGEQFGCALSRVKGRGEPPAGKGSCRGGTVHRGGEGIPQLTGDCLADWVPGYPSQRLCLLNESVHQFAALLGKPAQFRTLQLMLRRTQPLPQLHQRVNLIGLLTDQLVSHPRRRRGPAQPTDLLGELAIALLASPLDGGITSSGELLTGNRIQLVGHRFDVHLQLTFATASGSLYRRNPPDCAEL